jgi:hypothetical protein
MILVVKIALCIYARLRVKAIMEIGRKGRKREGERRRKE